MGLQTGIFSELLDEQRSAIARESRTSLESPQTPLSYPAEWLLDIFNGGRTDSGIRVSELTAFETTYFLGCVDLISGLIASLPEHVYERTVVANGRARHSIAYDHDLYDLISLEPNDEMSRFTFMKAYMAHVLAWGNGYAELQRDAGNQVVGIWPRNPYKTRPHRLGERLRIDPEPWRPFPVDLPAGALVYRTTDGMDDFDKSDSDAQSRNQRFIPAEDMLHVPGLAFDGRVGQDTVWLARQTIGLALATEKFGAKYYANFARPGGILELPTQSPEAREQSKRSWQEAQGGENAHRVAAMPPGTKFTPISNKPSDSQAVETEDRLRNKICSVFHVPPRLMGDTERSSKNSSEQENQELLQVTLSPWLAALKLEWKRKLFPSRGIGRTPKSRFYVDFDVTDMLRPDAESREKYYATGRQWGFLNTNDIRAYEKLNPIEEPWAEDYWMPINMTLAETPLDPNHQDGDGDGEKPDAEADRYARHFGRLFRDSFGRLLQRQNRDLRAITAAFGPILFSIRDAWFGVASSSLRVAGRPGTESDRFIGEYLGAMEKRASSWTVDTADSTSGAELKRAIRALKLSAYREAASLKAKEGEQE